MDNNEIIMESPLLQKGLGVVAIIIIVATFVGYFIKDITSDSVHIDTTNKDSVLIVDDNNEYSARVIRANDGSIISLNFEENNNVRYITEGDVK